MECVSRVFMHRLPEGEYRPLNPFCGLEEEDARTTFLATDPLDLPAEDERSQLEAGLREFCAVEVLDECRRVSQSAICVQDVGISLASVEGEPFVLLGRMQDEIRQHEVEKFRNVLHRCGISYAEAPPNVKFEGGDAVFIGDTIFLRLGGRTNSDAHEWIGQHARKRGYNVVPVKMEHGDYPHLTTMLTFAGFDGEGAPTVLRNTRYVGDVSVFHERGIRVLDINESCRREQWSANVLPCGKKLFIQDNCPRLRETLANAGFRNIVPLTWETMLRGKVGLTCVCFFLDPRRQLL